MATVTHITYGIMGDELADINPDAYMARLEEALQDHYPEAEIKITFASNLLGSKPASLQAFVALDDDYADSRQHEESVDRIAEQVFAEMCSVE